MDYQLKMTRYLGAFVDELARMGVHQVVISPGSRSTPIALLLAEHPDIEVFVHVDERSAAFFALGMAKGQQKPVAILCTSGSAAANYFPAIVEAYYGRVPLIVLTADRPHELRDIGAAQTINQVNLYGHHVKWFMDMPLPELTSDMIKFTRTVCARAVQTACSRPFGPIHLNFPLREPLIPDLDDPYKFDHAEKPPVIAQQGQLSVPDEFINILSSRLPQNGVFICGPMDEYHEEFKHSIVALAKTLNYPILADPLSQLRSGLHNKEMIINHYDAFLKDEEIRKFLKPELIIRFGAIPVSKSIMFYLKENESVSQMVIDSGQGWRDPVGSAEQFIYCDETYFCQKLLNEVIGQEKKNYEWFQKWQSINEITDVTLKENLPHSINEVSVVSYLQSAITDEANIVIGNSMPIRDIDTAFLVSNKKWTLFGNRGVNGIDGVISTALGISTNSKPTYLLIGDLSFYHDMNGLLAAKRYGLNLTIILINNNGGGIFSMLPQAKYDRHFELLFGTPIDLNFQSVAKLYGANYFEVKSASELCSVLNQLKNQKRLNIIEVQTNRMENASIRQEYWKKVSRKVKHVHPSIMKR